MAFGYCFCWTAWQFLNAWVFSREWLVHAGVLHSIPFCPNLVAEMAAWIYHVYHYLSVTNDNSKQKKTKKRRKESDPYSSVQLLGYVYLAKDYGVWSNLIWSCSINLQISWHFLSALLFSLKSCFIVNLGSYHGGRRKVPIQPFNSEHNQKCYWISHSLYYLYISN